MKESKDEGLGGEALRTSREVVAAFATDTITESIRALPAFCVSVSTLGWAGAGAGVSAGALAPVVGCAMILGGTVYLKWKEGQRSDADLKAHFGELAAALAKIDSGQSEATAMLTEIYERQRFVWAKLDGNDKQEIVDRVNKAFRGAGFDGSVSIQDMMGEIRVVRVGVDAIRGEMITKQDLAASEQRIRAWIEENKKSQTEPTQQEWPPELIEGAKLLRDRGDKNRGLWPRSHCAITLRPTR